MTFNFFKPEGNFINGQWVVPEDNQWRKVVDPSTQRTIGEIPMSTSRDVETAIKYASESFESGVWSRATPSLRGRVLWSLASLIEANLTEIAIVEAQDSGKPIREAEADIAGVVDVFQYFAGLASKVVGQTLQLPDGQLGVVLREPVGVVGAITPWNFPMYVAAWKVAAALAAGCSVVLKPSELASLTCLAMGPLARQVGLPDGVLNVVSGDGDPAGSTLAKSPSVGMLTFTGSTKTGRLVMKMRGEIPAPIQVELGGKSPHIIFSDADIDLAVAAAAFGAFYCQGQNCNAGSRLLVESSISDIFVERLVKKARSIRIGPLLELETQLGAIISRDQFDRIENFIETAKADGLGVACGGKRADVAGCESGLFYEPTVLTGVKSKHQVFQEEIFGPVVTVTNFDSEDEAISLANATDYGLAAGLWTNDFARAMRCAQRIKSGYVWINTYNSTPVEAPFGGVKRSGFGRDTGLQAIEAFMISKTIAIPSTKFADWYAS